MHRSPSFTALAAASLAIVACSSSSSSSPSSSSAVPPFHPDASCAVTEASPPDQGASHLPVGTSITYQSNPPSSGPHYPIWAAYQEFDHPVPRPYYVHNLEHGAVVFLYNCPTGCPAIVQGLRDIISAMPDDPACASSGVRVRAVLTPDPLLDTQVAAAAWDWTYTADCLDAPSLKQFALDHYGHGRELVCDSGTTQL